MSTTERKTKKLMQGYGYELVLSLPDEIRPYHRVYLNDTLTGETLIGWHEKELFDLGTTLIAAHGDIFEPALMAKA